MSGFPSETGGDRLAHQRAQMIHALNGHEVDADTAWAIIHRWDALVEVAKAARDRTHAGHGPNCSWPYSDERHQYPCDCGHLPLVDALARLDSGAAE